MIADYKLGSGFLNIEFKCNNIEQFTEQFEKHCKWKSENYINAFQGHPGNPPMPILTFYCDDIIQPGYYSFTIKDFTFSNAYISCYSEDYDGKMYRCEGYNVIRNL